MLPHASSADKAAARAELALLKTPLESFLQLPAYLLSDFLLHQYSAALRDSGCRAWAMQQQHIAGFQSKPVWGLPLCYLSHLRGHHCWVLHLRQPFLCKKEEIKATEYSHWVRSTTFQIPCTITKSREQNSPTEQAQPEEWSSAIPQPTAPHSLPAKELTLSPAVAPASVWSAPREAIGLTEELLLELGEEPAIKIKSLNFKACLSVLLIQLPH